MELTNQAVDRIKLQELQLNLSRTRALQESDLLPLADLDTDRIAEEALKKKVAEYDSVIQNLRQRHEDTVARCEHFKAEYTDDVPDSELLLNTFKYAAKVQEQRIERVNLAILNLALKAPAKGIVTEIYCRPGEYVAMGQPVASIIEPVSSEIVAYIPEERIFDFKRGTPVTLRRKAAPEQSYQSVVAAMGSAVVQLPNRLDPGAVILHWGLPVYIPMPELLQAKPGEAFDVIF
jgi:multidrug resistance efflux pump